MQDIRKPYTRSRSNNDLQSRVEQFESARYARSSYQQEDPVEIPVKRVRRDVKDMDMYPKRRHDDFLEDEEDFEEDKRPTRREPLYRDPRTRYTGKKSSLSTFAFIGGVVALVIGVGLYTYVFNSATITIVPKYKDVNDLNRTFSFVSEGSTKDGIPFIIETTSLSKTKTLNLSETRKVESKASGKITIYNNYDSNPQKLIKNTRFLSTKGKIYRINQSVEVPGKKGDKEGSIEVMLYADSNGAEYNTEATEFSIPGFKGSPREKAFYAKSTGSISGGASGNTSLVALSDLNAAKDALTLSLDKEIKVETQKITKEGYVPMYTAVDVTYEDNEKEVLSGLTAVYKVTATGHLPLADASMIAEAVGETLVEYKDEDVRLSYTESLVYTRKQSDRLASSTGLSMLVEGKPRVIWVSDIDGIKSMVKGKDRDDFKPLMKTIASIESAEINFSPLWLSSFPSDLSKITVTESLPKR